MNTLLGKNILIASLQPWNSPMVSKHYIALELTKFKNNVLFLGLERRFKDNFLNRSFRQHNFHIGQADGILTENIKVLPGFLRSRILYKLSLQSVRGGLGLEYNPDIIFSFDPQFCILHEIFSEALKVYYCVDHVASNLVLEKAEKRMLVHSDLVITASRQLYNDLKNEHSNVSYVPHGVSLLEEYVDCNLKNKIDHWFAERKNQQVIGFVGNVSSQLDFELINGIAEKNPNSLIALIGPIMPDVKTKIAHLPANVILPGPVPAHGVKYCLAHFDVGIVPYLHNRYNHSRNPIKIMQYIAAGLPVVSTQVGETFEEGCLVSQSENREEFHQYLKTANVNSSISKDLQSNFKKENSWKQRVLLLDNIISEFYKE